MTEPDPIRDRATATPLTLDPLDPASMDKLVEALVPGMPSIARTGPAPRTRDRLKWAICMIACSPPGL